MWNEQNTDEHFLLAVNPTENINVFTGYSGNGDNTSAEKRFNSVVITDDNNENVLTPGSTEIVLPNITTTSKADVALYVKEKKNDPLKINSEP